MASIFRYASLPSIISCWLLSSNASIDFVFYSVGPIQIIHNSFDLVRVMADSVVSFDSNDCSWVGHGKCCVFVLALLLA